MLFYFFSLKGFYESYTNHSFLLIHYVKRNFKLSKTDTHLYVKANVRFIFQKKTVYKKTVEGQSKIKLFSWTK